MPGADGVVIGKIVGKVKPDGHMLLLMSKATAVSAGLFQAAPFVVVPTARNHAKIKSSAARPRRCVSSM